MPRQPSPPRLWKRPERRDKSGKLTHIPTWIILDGGRQFSTGIDADDVDGANRALAAHINRQHEQAASSGPRSLENIPVADVLNLYAKDVVAGIADPKAAVHRLRRLGAFFTGKTLADINGPVCREYTKAQNSDSCARRDLQDLSAAIGHHLKEGLHNQIVKVWKPPARVPRERWLTRSEAAQLLRAAWRHREVQHGEPTAKHTRRHVARFILVGLYTGSRASVITQAALERVPGRPYIDAERGVYQRRPEGERETKKRKPTIPLPPRLLAHVRRWKRLGFRHVVEYGGQPIKRIHSGTFRLTVKAAGLDEKVLPHTLRHTAATWLMQKGTDIWQASGFLGMTTRTLERNYGHHHPDQFDSVLQAFSKHRTANGSPTIAVNRR
jgi:integrase